MPAADDFVAALAEAWESFHMAGNASVRPPTVVVGVSGGADSLALWHGLTAGGLHPVAGLVAASLDHGLRAEAAADVAFVREVAERSGAAFHARRVNVRALARARGASIEEAAREARYAFLADVAHSVGARHVAVAHNADDQAETVLLHLLRGTGLAGLRGMLPGGPLPGAPDLVLLRPLLAVSRVAIDAYCATHGLSPREDASNLDTTLLRNRVRHELLPALESVNPRLREALRRLATTAAGDEALLHELTATALARLALPLAGSVSTDAAVRLDLAGWRALPLGLRRRALREAAARVGAADLGFAAIESARRIAEDGPVGRAADLPGDLVVTVGYTSLSVSRGVAAPPAAPQLAGDEPVTLRLPGSVPLADGWQLNAVEAAKEGREGSRRAGAWTVSVSLPPDVEELTVRGRRPGERFQPQGLGGRSTTVKELMIDRKMPAALRARWPVVATDAHLLWIVGHRLDERAAVGPMNRRAWQLVCLSADGDTPPE